MIFEVLPLLLVATQAARIVQSNDDGWAENNIRTLNAGLNAAGNDVVLSAPAENKSGSGKLTPLFRSHRVRGNIQLTRRQAHLMCHQPPETSRVNSIAAQPTAQPLVPTRTIHAWSMSTRSQ